MQNDFTKRYAALRRAALEKYFSNVNPMQQKAVFQTEGPVLLLAGAGSGKTTAVISRVANLVAFGKGYHSD